MYSELSIQTIEKRIGWSDPSDLPISISAENKQSDSGRMFNGFHSMVLLSNIYATVPAVNMDENSFNEYLSSVRKQAVLSVLNRIFDQNKEYISTNDYSDTIINRSALFDDAIGYSVAANIIEMFISSARSNLEERNSKMSYQIFKIELEGAKNENGYPVTKGLLSKLDTSIKRAREIIFPIIPIVTSEPIW